MKPEVQGNLKAPSLLVPFWLVMMTTQCTLQLLLDASLLPAPLALRQNAQCISWAVANIGVNKGEDRNSSLLLRALGKESNREARAGAGKYQNCGKQGCSAPGWSITRASKPGRTRLLGWYEGHMGPRAWGGGMWCSSACIAGRNQSAGFSPPPFRVKNPDGR